MAKRGAEQKSESAVFYSPGELQAAIEEKNQIAYKAGLLAKPIEQAVSGKFAWYIAPGKTMPDVIEVEMKPGDGAETAGAQHIVETFGNSPDVCPPLKRLTNMGWKVELGFAPETVGAYMARTPNTLTIKLTKA